MRPIRARLTAGTFLTLALVASTGVHASGTTSRQSEQSGWTGWSACDKPQLASYRCGTLTVPLDRTPGTSDTRTLDLSVLEGGNPDADRTLLMLTGGPGQPGPVLAPRILLAFAGILEDYRIVMLDQRGTGDRALDCPLLQEERGYSDLRVPTREAVLQCAEILGDERAHYATTDSVADFEALRSAIGVDRWAVDGVSYGTYTGQRYAAAHPERVTHLVLDSVIPLSGFSSDVSQGFDDYTRVLRDVCTTRACPGDMPDDLSTILRREPDLGPMMFDFVTSVAYADPHDFLDLPQWLHDGATGDMGAIHHVYALFKEGFAAPAGLYSQGIQASTFCADVDFPWGGADSPEVARDETADAFVNRLTDTFPFNREASRGNGLMALCENWPRVADRVVPASQLSLKGVRALVINGERDLGTPLHWAREVHAQIPGSTLVVVPDAGHSIQVSRRHPEVNAQVAEFLLSD